MYGGFLTTGPWVIDLPDPGRDRELAEQAVAYLRGQGLDDHAVVQFLQDEFEIDLPTAETMAYPPGGQIDVGIAGGWAADQGRLTGA